MTRKIVQAPPPAGPTPHDVARLARLDLSPAQSMALKCIAGEPLDADELRTFHELAGVESGGPNPRGYRETIIRAGRRSGKTVRLCAPFIVSALLAPVDHLLAPGERGRVLLIGPTLAHVRQALDATAGLLDALRIPYARRELEIEPKGLRTVVRATVADHMAPRGGTAVAAVIDEAALLPFDPEADGYDEEMIAAVRPSLATTKGKLLMVSSPWVMQGVHFDGMRRHLGKVGGDVLALDAATWVWHPALSEQETKRLEPNPVRHAREWGAVAGENEESFLRASDVRACVDVGVQERPSAPGVQYVAGLDVAFRRDRTALVIVHRELRKRPGIPPAEVVVVDCIRVWSPTAGQRLDFDSTIAEVANVCRRYGNCKIVRDSFAGDAVASALQMRGVESEELPMSAPAQASRYEFLSQKIRARDALRLVDHEDCVRELIGLRVRLHAAGRIEVAAPNKKGSHDDIADALALATEASKRLPAGGDIRCVVAITRDDANISVTASWHEVTVDALGFERVMPAAPPRGSAAWHEARANAKAGGWWSPDFDDEGTTTAGLNAVVKND